MIKRLYENHDINQITLIDATEKKENKLSFYSQFFFEYVFGSKMNLTKKCYIAHKNDFDNFIKEINLKNI